MALPCMGGLLNLVLLLTAQGTRSIGDAACKDDTAAFAVWLSLKGMDAYTCQQFKDTFVPSASCPEDMQKACALTCNTCQPSRVALPTGRTGSSGPCVDTDAAFQAGMFIDVSGHTCASYLEQVPGACAVFPVMRSACVAACKRCPGGPMGTTMTTGTTGTTKTTQYVDEAEVEKCMTQKCMSKIMSCMTKPGCQAFLLGLQAKTKVRTPCSAIHTSVILKSSRTFQPSLNLNC